MQIIEQVCLWYGCWRTDTVRVVLLRDTRRTSTTGGYDIALATTDLTAAGEQIIARYAARWAIEVMFFDVKHILGVGQARNRVQKAVERTVVFGLIGHTLLIIWYCLHGQPATDTAHRRAGNSPSFPDGTGTLRLLPWASHPAVTHNARQGGDSPLDTGPDHILVKRPPAGVITHYVRHHVARLPTTCGTPATTSRRRPARAPRTSWPGWVTMTCARR